MNPREYEEQVSEHYRKQGYKVELTPQSSDYGIDVFATKGKEKIGIQAKMYEYRRKVNRQMIMELHGAKDYFDCTKAVIATNGEFIPDAITVANKLNIEILHFDGIQSMTTTGTKSKRINFETIWEKYIITLEGKTLTKANGETNKILRADWGGIERVTSNGNKGRIKIEIFKQAINKLLSDGSITRDEINQNYVGRASSGVVLVLSQVPFFQLTEKPSGLQYKKQ